MHVACMFCLKNPDTRILKKTTIYPTKFLKQKITSSVCSNEVFDRTRTPQVCLIGLCDESWCVYIYVCIHVYVCMIIMIIICNHKLCAKVYLCTVRVYLCMSTMTMYG